MPVLTATLYRQYAGLLPTDPPADAEIERALWRYETLVGSYLGRPLDPARYVENFYFIDRSPVILGHWPVVQVNSILKNSEVINPTDVLIHNLVGMIYHHGKFCGDQVTIDYIAGFNPMPDDMQLVIFTLAEAMLSGAGGGAAALQQAPVKSETVYGVSSVTYDTSLLVKEDSGIGTSSFPELGPYITVLNKYRGEYRYV